MSTLSCILNKYIYFVIRTICVEMIIQSVKALDLLGICDLIFRHITDHFPSGHLAHGPLFDYFTVLFFAKNAGDIADILWQIFGDTNAVLLGRQIEDAVRFIKEVFGKPITPVGVQVFALPYPQLRLHFQPVGCHTVKGLQHSVKSG